LISSLRFMNSCARSSRLDRILDASPIICTESSRHITNLDLLNTLHTEQFAKLRDLDEVRYTFRATFPVSLLIRHS
jgi:hypothetical protein